MSDVDHPSHYNQGNIECIDALEASMSTAEFQGFLKGNALKYIWRSGLKGDFVQDLDKASWYLAKLKTSILENG